MPILNMIYGATGGGGGWQPGANTIGYRPLTSKTTVNDQSSNKNNGIQTGTISYGTNLGVDCAYFNGGSNYIRIPYNSSLNSTSITISVWCAVASGYNTNNRGILDRGNFNGHGQYSIANNSNFEFRINGDNNVTQDGAMFTGNNIWTYITCTYDGTGAKKIYKNGTPVRLAGYSYNITASTPLTIGGYYSSSYCFNGYISKVILENKVRTDVEVADYYNQTKSLYGIL